MTIAAKHFDPQLGIDIHTYLIPPSPIPIPLPTPHIGIVLDPFDYLPFIGGTVHVNGLKRATAGTGGLDIHIPVGGVWMPPLKIAAGPQWDDELFMGSKTVLADGDPFSKITMPVLACNIVGMIAPFRIRKPKKPHMSLLLPTTFNIAIPTNVFVGGPPTVSWTALAMAAGLSIFGKILKKTGIAGAAGAAFKKLRQKLFANMKPGFLKCKVLRAEPVDIRDGSVSVTHEDFAIPGRLPLTWTREYRSTDTHAGHCGHGWHTPADVRLELDADGSVLFHGPDMPALFPHLPHGEGIDNAVREFVDGARLIREGHELWVRTKDGLRYGFAAGPANVTTLQTRALPIERIEDLCGNHWRFERGNGQLVRIVESGVDGLQGRFLEIDSRQGRIDRMQLHDPATGLNYPLVSYRYQDGDLIAALDALDAARTFEYRQHRMVRHTDRVGLSFHYAYDAQWRVVRAWGDGGLHDYKFRYDELLDETEITDSLGHVSIVKFDENGLPLCEIDPLDGVTVFEYAEVGRTTAVVDPMGLRMEFAYDERGNLLKLTRADGSTLVTEYDSEDRAQAFIEPDGARWSQIWNERGLLVEQVTPLGSVSRYEYDASGKLRAQVDPLGASIRFEYDRFGQPQRMIDPLGAVLRLQYDALGRLLQHTDAAGQTKRFDHDAKGRLLLAIDSDGSTARAEYDDEDQLVRYLDERGGVTKLEYSGLGKVARRLQPDGHSVIYRYDTEEQLLAVINQRGEVYGLRRDALGRIVEEIDYWGQSRRYRYDASGRLISATDPLDQQIVYESDKMGRVTTKVSPDPDHADLTIKEYFRYDIAGRLVELRSRSHKVLREFDIEGRLLSEDQDGFRVENRYDPLGRRLSRETSCGNRVRYAFDLRGQLIEVAINDEVPIRIERDVSGRATAEHLSPQVRRALGYDRNGLLTAQAVTRGEAPLFETRYDYDRGGNLIERADSQHGVDRYAYDPADRILSHVDPRGRITTFLNDPAGDRLRTHVRETRMKRVAGGESMPEAWTRDGDHDGINYVFDRAGNLIRRGPGRNPDRGAASSGMEEAGFVLRWDAHHRLIESVNFGKSTRYGYDALGRRIFKRDSTRTVRFFWDGDALLGEIAHATDAGDAPSLMRGTVVDYGAELTRKKALVQLYAKAREYVYYPSSYVPLALLERKRSVPGRLSTVAIESEITPAVSSGRAKDRLGFKDMPRVDEVYRLGGKARSEPHPAIVADPVRREESIGMLGGFALGQPTTPSALQPLKANANTQGDVVAASSVTSVSKDRLVASGDESATARRGVGSASVHSQVLASRVIQERPDSTDRQSPDGGEWVTSVYHFHVDPNGCPTRLTDADGVIQWSVSYAAWGEVIATHGNDVDQPLRFQGQYFDAETGLHYNRFRYYDALSAAYISQDPIGLVAGESLYCYAPAPQAWIDPCGLARRRTLSGTTAGGLSRTSPEWRQRYGPASMREHHLIPQAMMRDSDFMEQIRRSGIADPDDFIHRQIAIIPNSTHITIHENGWNDGWKRWFSNNPSFNRKDLQRQISAMMSRHNLPRSSRNFAGRYGSCR
jgi:RHS repeat-associated protein